MGVSFINMMDDVREGDRAYEPFTFSHLILLCVCVRERERERVTVCESE